MGVQWGKMIAELSQAGRAAAEGFDFVQPVGDLAAGFGGEELRVQADRVRGGGAPFRVCAVPLPPEVRVTQKGFNLYVWMEHLKKAVAVMAELGCRRLVWSDGRSRVLPIEGGTAEPKEQVLQFLHLLCGVAGELGMTVLVEPLGPRRTNFLNSLQETEEFLPRVRMENVSALISLRELEPIGLPLSDLPAYLPLIGHVQLDNPAAYGGERICPRPNDGCDYGAFLRALKSAGYAADISLPADADAGALAYCRDLWSR